MPVHGIRLDLEFAAIAIGASALSFYITGQVVSNVLFTTLIAALFFLMGLHIDIPKLERNVHKRRELAIGLGMVYIIVPLLALLLSRTVSGGLQQGLIAIGVSTAAIGSPVVWSNIGKAEDGTALLISTLSLFVGIALIPVLLVFFSSSLPVTEFMGRNLLFLGVPLALGMFSQRFRIFLFDDMKHHFSKLALWLLILIMGAQFQLVYQARGLSFINELVLAVPLLTGFVLLTFLIGYLGSRNLGVMERKARSIGFVSGSKGIAVALFVAAQLSPEAVVYVSIHYFVRQVVCGSIAEFFRQGGDIHRMFNNFQLLKKVAP